jgi:hypothetical protein
VNLWLPVSLASLLILPATSLSSQNHPQFSGSWRLDPERSESAAEDNTPGAVIVNITQTEQDLTIVTTKAAVQNRTVHRFVATPTAPFAIDGATARAYWNGAALVTEGTRLVQGQTVATRETRTLSADGNEMMVEVVVIVQHGYQTRGGRNYGMGRDVYTRVIQ